MNTNIQYIYYARMIIHTCIDAGNSALASEADTTLDFLDICFDSFCLLPLFLVNKEENSMHHCSLRHKRAMFMQNLDLTLLLPLLEASRQLPFLLIVSRNKEE